VLLAKIELNHLIDKKGQGQNDENGDKSHQRSDCQAGFSSVFSGIFDFHRILLE
jgi:hypothetical protein